MAVIKTNLGWRFKDFKGMTFEEIEFKFAEVWKQEGSFRRSEELLADHKIGRQLCFLSILYRSPKATRYGGSESAMGFSEGVP
nr:hypothetical protein [Tanacetum cinerariifolium]